MKAEEPYVGKPLVRFREGRGGNWLHREHPVYSTPLFENLKPEMP